VADTTWALISLSTRQLCRSDSIDFGFEHEAPAELSIPLRFRVPRSTELELLGTRRIVYSDLDYNMHMNNTKYPDTVCDFLPCPENLRVVGMSFSYLKEARYGDIVRVERADGGDGVYYFRTYRGEELCLEAMIRTAPRAEKESLC
jgi:acyl-ACP thioesterase